MADVLDRGDQGAVPDPSWEEHWSTWQPEAIQRRIAETASYGILGRVQVEAILQGLPPPNRGADATNTVLAEFQDVVDRFRQDVTRGCISRTPTPQELVAWANAMGHDLSQPFLSAIEAQAVKVGAPRVGTAPGGVAVTLPPWVPNQLGSSVAAPKKRKVGRPTTANAATQALVEAARDILSAESAQGRQISLLNIGKRLQGTPCAGPRGATTIQRILNNKLDTKKAKRKALLVAAGRVQKR